MTKASLDISITNYILFYLTDIWLQYNKRFFCHNRNNNNNQKFPTVMIYLIWWVGFTAHITVENL